ncbi:MAG: hypothetical protein J6K17_01205 [Oscillospiraceae bacterium]|nr:hypothetical protein [Oscillospiraceae bacterium]
MKITAHFNSPDDADFAAGALKKLLSPHTKIETENLQNFFTDTDINIFPVFNLTSITPTYSVPVRTNRNKDNISNKECILKIICRSEEAADASRIIIGYGGRNITKI